MNKGQRRIILLGLTIIFIEVTILLYRGTISDFIPQPVASTVALLNNISNLKLERGIIDFPAYIYLLSFIMAVTNMNPVKLTLIPVLTLPFFLSFLMFVYSLSNKRNFKLITLLLAFMMLSNSLIGSGKISIYTHGFGAVLYYSAIAVLVRFIKSDNRQKIGIMFIILGSTLVMLSYDVSYQLIIFTMSLTLILFLKSKDNFRNGLIKSILLLLATPIVVLLSFKYVYNTFIPIFKSDAGVSNVFVVITKFQVQYLGHNNGFLEGLVLKYPTILTAIYSIKYVLYIIPVLVVALALIKTKSLRLEKSILCIYISLLISSIAYSISKSLLEQTVLSWIFVAFVISMLSMTYSVRYKKVIRFMAYLVLISLIGLNILSIQLASDYKLVHKTPQYYPYIVSSTKWGLTYGKGNMKVPDVFTYSWALLAYSECGHSCTGKTPEYLPNTYVFNLYLGKRLPKGVIIPINYRSEYVELFAWRTLKPFNLYRNVIQTNPSVTGIVYSLNNDLVILYTGGDE